MLKIMPMSPNHFQKYMDFAVNEYATEKIAAGTWTAETAQKNSQLTYDRLLPNGLATPDNFFYSIFKNSEIIGYIWFGTDNENASTAFIFDFEIYKTYQNSGFGSKTLELVSNEAKNMGFTSLGLHVFGSNSRAIHVYQKSGFNITDIKMQKQL
ncbi:GNAT family N-acetyltransferase [Leuconostoc gasicomitatum]|uniref:Acetyltransferase, GNAT family n=1 Tax=Leuconostoc gasicomitatum TaxID=115778 RepID=A0ABM9UZW0_9LACO|nr:GNAT family N-acetyltransferase [Leuconostoc gasicomitatum]MBZ5944459.1 GNAT family N-acetyltransferase [Leuconostoc gasicomitatum]MBZ5945993.1 GNAT family N-acetyltransferase [Leuconostoc gasicomitatum]MBZ5949072.1 GNAT family N-acetyltransferase [Leuconostoc gasicomitatum]MBZ5950955.1 GNAT family N-acetyltransferase [Leuconostoc gasicomitatum]MBZ5953108.1 GNAT family N-acetyltransferase [Leuconostoc gasicomitatum]